MKESKYAQYRHLRDEGFTLQEIADRFGVSHQAVSCSLKTKRSLYSGWKESVTRRKHDALMMLWEEGLTDKSIAYLMSMTPTTIGCWRKRLGLSRNKTYDIRKGKLTKVSHAGEIYLGAEFGGRSVMVKQTTDSTIMIIFLKDEE